MRVVLFLLMAVAFVQAQEQKCRVEGQVFSIAGAPLTKATLNLRAASQMNQSNFSNYSATSDAEGKFAIDDITPGTYILSAERVGYLQQFYGARSTTAGATQIKLESGQTMRDMVFKLTPQGMIYGRIVDADGDPMPNASFGVFRWVRAGGKKTLEPAPIMGWGPQFSQADGTFIIGGLPAGRYYLNAAAVHLINGNERPTKEPKESYLTTYFPDSLDIESATPIAVAAGQEVRGIEIRLRKGRVFEVRGTVEAAPGLQFPAYGNLSMTQKDKESGIGGGFDDRTKTFRFQNVLPGTYEIYAHDTTIETKDATGEFTKTTSLVGRTQVTVDDRDLTNVVLHLQTGLEVRGRAKIEGMELSKMFADHTTPEVRLSNGEGWRDFETLDKDGTFRIQGLAPSTYDTQFQNLPENFFVKTILFEGQDVTDKEIDISTGGQLEILLSANGAEVTGIVRDGDGKPIPGAVAQICDANGKCPKIVNADQNGQFDLKGLASGEYKLFAWEDRGDGIITDPDFRKLFESKAAAVKVAEKSRESLDAILITKDAMDAEAAKIQ